MSVRILSTLLLVFFSAVTSASEKSRVLMVTQSAGYRHGSVTRQDGELSPSEVAMVQLGETTELFTVDCTQDVAADFTRENLDKYDIVMFYTSGQLPIAESDLDYFLNVWLKTKGHGFLGFHAATDTYREHEPYWDMVGGTFNGHPWGAGTTVTIAVHDPEHPVAAPFGGQFRIRDEIYQYRHWQPEKVRVLMSLDMSKCRPSKPYHVPVAWVKEYGDGRVYVNNLGHNPQTWTDQRYLDSIAVAVRWIRREVDAPATPNPELSAQQEKIAQQAAAEVAE